MPAASVQGHVGVGMPCPVVSRRVVRDDLTMGFRGVLSTFRQRREPVPALPAPHAVPPLNKVEEAWRVLDLVNGWVIHAEAKLGVTFAFLGALFAGLIAMAASFKQPSATILWLEFSAVALLVIAVTCASVGLLPQFKSSWKEPEQKRKLSKEEKRRAHRRNANPLYYRDISEFEQGDYLEDLPKALDRHEVVLKHLSQQIYAISGVATRKFKWSHRAIVWGVLSLLMTGVVGMALLLGW